MGTTGPKIFEDDKSMDWVAEFVEAEDKTAFALATLGVLDDDEDNEEWVDVFDPRVMAACAVIVGGKVSLRDLSDWGAIDLDENENPKAIDVSGIKVEPVVYDFVFSLLEDSIAEGKFEDAHDDEIRKEELRYLQYLLAPPDTKPN